MNFLFIVDRLTELSKSGYTLRVVGLARALEKLGHNCSQIHIPLSENQNIGIPDACFLHALTLPKPPKKLSWHRHLRTSNSTYWRKAAPSYFKAMQDKITGAIREWDIEVVVAVALETFEFAEDLGVPVIADDYDCRTLTLLRQGALVEADFLGRLRYRFQEASLATTFSAVTTISPADRSALISLGVPPNKLHLIPNGVDQEKFPADNPDNYLNAIAFWGNLEFSPNKTAIADFYNNVYRNRLSDLTWLIAGRNLDPVYNNMSRESGNIKFLGFVDDLQSALSPAPIMVNPMVQGSGMKNKVLEAFCLGKVVVSTSLGVESFEGIENNVHFVLANSPDEFEIAIRRLLNDLPLRISISNAARDYVNKNYSWCKVANKLVNCALVSGGDFAR